MSAYFARQMATVAIVAFWIVAADQLGLGAVSTFIVALVLTVVIMPSPPKDGGE
jgi:hypothetical protein